MKLLTLNTHSLTEANYEEKLHAFAQGILAAQPEVIALQEVNQTRTAPAADEALTAGYHPAQSAIPLHADNHAARAASLLREAGAAYRWTWLPVKVGYGKYDEGLALLSLKRKISRTEVCLLSRTDDYFSWKTRKALAVQLQGLPDWFCCVHMGWWQDPEEPAAAQWQTLNAFLSARARPAPVWLMGDFNAPSERRGEGYDQIAADGWHDTFLLAAHRDAGQTVPGEIDGWRGMPDATIRSMRLDHIWCSHPAEVASSRVIFNGENHPTVSDHFGVMIETQSK